MTKSKLPKVRVWVPTLFRASDGSWVMPDPSTSGKGYRHYIRRDNAKIIEEILKKETEFALRDAALKDLEK